MTGLLFISLLNTIKDRDNVVANTTMTVTLIFLSAQLGNGSSWAHIAKTSGNVDYDTILGRLTRVYGNPNGVRKPRDRLSDPLVTYIVKFEDDRHQNHGYYHNQPAGVKILTTSKGHNSTLRNCRSQQPSLASCVNIQTPFESWRRLGATVTAEV